MATYDSSSRPYVAADLFKAASTMRMICSELVIPDLTNVREQLDLAVVAAHSASGVVALAGDGEFYDQGKLLEQHLRHLSLALFDIERLGILAHRVGEAFGTAEAGIIADDPVKVGQATAVVRELLAQETALGKLVHQTTRRHVKKASDKGSPDHEKHVGHDSDIEPISEDIQVKSNALPGLMPLVPEQIDQSEIIHVSKIKDNNPISDYNLSESSLEADPVDFVFGATTELNQLETNELMASSESKGDEDDLNSIFAGELQELMDKTIPLLNVWISGKDVSDCVRQLERIAHTIKGSASTIGLILIAAEGKRQQELLGELLEGDPSNNDLSMVIAGFYRIADIGQINWKAPIIGSLESDTLSERQSLTNPIHLLQHEVVQVLDESFSHLDKMANPDTESEAKKFLKSQFHRIRGSALVLNQAQLAKAIDAALSSLGMQNSDLAIQLSSIANALGDSARAKLFQDWNDHSRAQFGSNAQLQDLHIDAQEQRSGIEIFQAEALDLMQQITDLVLRLSDQNGHGALGSLLRVCHTIKGTASTMGVRALANAMHIFEEKLLTWEGAVPEEGPAQARRALVPIAMAVERWDFSRLLPGDVERCFASIGTKSKIKKSNDNSGSKVFGRNKVSSYGAQGSDAIDSSNRAPESAFDGHNSSTDSNQDLARRFIRVPAQRLQNLMTLTGELIITRSQLSDFTLQIRPALDHLSTSRKRLHSLINNFAEQHEFTLVGTSDNHKRISSPLKSGESDKIPSYQSSFSALELDQYSDLNILARQLLEVGFDIDEAQTAILKTVNGFRDETRAFGSLISDVQNGITKARLVVIGSLFDRLRMPALDVADQEGKQIAISCNGSNIELDKLIVDDLYAPLLHIVRNAVSHGIESPELRKSKGKSPKGIIQIDTVQEAGSVIISVSDDGMGIDCKRLHQLGIARNLIPPETPIDDQSVLNLIFASGLSTRETVSSISGRGVGGDVAKREIERLGGTIRVVTQQDKGSKFIISVPVSISIITCLMLRIGNLRFAVPALCARSAISLLRSEIHKVGQDAQIHIGKNIHHLVDLAPLVQIEDAVFNRKDALVIISKEDSVAIAVDQIIGSDEIVVKGTASLLGHGIVSSVAVLGDGEIVPILSPDHLVLLARNVCHGDLFSSFYKNSIAPSSRKEKSTNAQLSGNWFNEVEPIVQGSPMTSDVSGVDADSRSEVKRDNDIKGIVHKSENLEDPINSIEESPEVTELASSLQKPIVPCTPVVQRQSGKPRVLFIDDSVSARTQGKRLLLSAGYVVHVAVDGEDGLRKLAETGNIDLVFTDLEMPRKNGYQVLAEIRQDPRWSHIPVVLITSRIGPQHRQRAEELGASEYLGKPFDRDILVAQVKRFVPGES